MNNQFRLFHCEKHNHTYTVQWWNIDPSPDKCKYCKRENLNRYYEEFNKSFEDGNKHV